MTDRDVAGGATTILVLPPDEDLIERIQRKADALGWTLDVSRGTEQIVVGLVAGGDLVALAASVPGREEIDVVPLAGREQYARKRRRRRFMTSLVTGLGILTAVGWAIPIAGFLKPPREPLSSPRRVQLVRADQMPENSAKRFRVRGKQLLLVHTVGERFYALSGRCSFMDNCQLEWDPELRRIICPCHGCVFDVHGNIVEGPPSVPLAAHPVERTGDHVFILREN